MKVATVILTLNEEPNISGCIEQFKPYVDYVLVLDGASGDATVEIASKIANRVETRIHQGDFSEEYNYAWSLVPDDVDWTIFSDADEMFHQRFTPNIKEILGELEKKYRKLIALRFPRANLPKCEDYPNFQVRVMKNGKGIKFVNKIHTIPTLLGRSVADIDGSCMTLLDLPIWHMPRRKGIRRPWW